MEYIHLELLGGRRKPKHDPKNNFWRHPSFRGYADYMETSAFKNGFKEIKKLASEGSSAIMCSDAVCWSCHRAMISDALKVDGWEVIHIMPENKENEHPFTQPAKIMDGQLHYGD